MRKLLLIWTLILFSVGVATAEANIPNRSTVESNFKQVPYIPARNTITQQDNQICKLRATIGAAALSNAKYHDVKLKDQLKDWDKFAMSEKAEQFDATELLIVREFIKLSYQVLKEMPNITPNNYGDIIYMQCVKEKSAIMVSF